MKRRKSPFRHGIMIVSGMLLICFCASCLYADHDTSQRTDLNFSYTFNEQFRAVSYVFLQADEHVSNYDYAEWGIGLRYQTPVTWLSFLVYYQQGYAKDDDRHWLLEQKPSINLNTQVNLFDFRIANQIRYEYRITPGWHDYRIKNTLEIIRPGWFITPCVGWELFYENRDKAVMLNRFKFGISRDIGGHVSTGPYYRVDFSNVNSHWEWTRQLIGFQVTIKY
ncbi:MAG: DUF2490 domain-containing protein [Deltaproteobacteria bacterium]